MTTEAKLLESAAGLEPASIEALLHPKHYIAGGVYAKELVLRQAGTLVVSHAHKYDHLSLLVRGQVQVTVDGVSRVYSAPCGVEVKAGAQHEIIAMVDDCLWYCLHAVPAEFDGESLIDEVLVKQAG